MTAQRKKTAIAALICLVALGLLASEIIHNRGPVAQAGAPSQEGPRGGMAGARGPQGPRGRITAISAASITIEGRDQVPKTFAIASSVAVTVDGATSSVSALKVGERASLTSADGKTVTAIHIRNRRGGPRGGPPTLGGPRPVPATATS